MRELCQGVGSRQREAAAASARRAGLRAAAVYMHSTGSLAVQPAGTELASRTRGVAPARRRPLAAVVPAVGWLVTMNALQVAGVSVAVSEVSNHTCGGTGGMSGRCHPMSGRCSGRSSDYMAAKRQQEPCTLASAWQGSAVLSQNN